MPERYWREQTRRLCSCQHLRVLHPEVQLTNEGPGSRPHVYEADTIPNLSPEQPTREECVPARPVREEAPVDELSSRQ